MNLYVYEEKCRNEGKKPDDVYGYHITSKANLHSIFVNGLVPERGKNSTGVNERSLNIYFTTSEQIDWWIKRFEFDKNDIVVLKFLCKDWKARPSTHNDCFIKHSVSSEDILVVDGEEVLLTDYYNENRNLLTLEETKKVVKQLKSILQRLNEVSGKEFQV